MKHLPIVDYLRGFAIATIVIMHCMALLNLPSIIGQAVKFGGAGVHVFILCSGFGLYLSWLNKPLSYVDFLKRRFNKLYIKYAAVVILYVIYASIAHKPYSLNQVASHLLLYKMFNSDLDTCICHYYWFISTIIQFYLCWPLIVRLYKVKHSLWISFAISIGWATLSCLLGFANNVVWSCCFLQFLWEIILGMKLADIYFQTGKLEIPSFKWLIPCAIGGVALTGILGYQDNFLKLYNDVPSLIGYASVALIIYKLNLSFINRFLQFTSKFGYELYLVHGLVLFMVTDCLRKFQISQWITVSIILVLSYFIAWFWVKFVEGPIKTAIEK